MKAVIKRFFSTLVVMLITLTASADVTFTIGQNGTWHHNDQSWAGKERGLSGWTSQSLVDPVSGDTAFIELATSADVFFSNDGSVVSASDFPLRVSLTDHQVISGPNILLYNGFIIKSVTVTLRNDYGTVSNDHSTDYYHNEMSVSVGGAANKVTASSNTTSSATTFTRASGAFASIQQMRVVVDRSIAAAFQRSSEALGRDAFREIYAYLKIDVTVEKVPQQVEYTVYRRLFNSTTQQTEDVPLVKGDYFLNSSNYDGVESKAYFTETVSQYVGENPRLPGDLIRMGCIYGYDCATIGETTNGEPFRVKVYYTVDDTNIPFHYSYPDFDPRNYSTIAQINTVLNSYNPEYKYFWHSKYQYKSGDNNNSTDAYTVGDYPYKDKRYEKLATGDASHAQQVAFIGNPYNTIVYLIDNDENKRNGSPSDAAVGPWAYETGSKTYLYFGITYVKENANAPIETDYFALTDNIPGWRNFAYIGPTCSNYQTVQYDRVYGRTYYANSPNNVANINYYKFDDDGAFYYEYGGTNTYSWAPKGFMLRLTLRTDDISLTYHPVYVDANGTPHSDVKFFDETGVMHPTYIRADYRSGDVICIPRKYQRPYYTYTYYTDAALTQPVSTVDGSWTSKDIYVKMEWNGPFTFSTSDAGPWYYVTLNDRFFAAHGHSPYWLQNRDEAVISPLHQWRFVRNDDFSVSLVNRWYGSDYLLTNTYGDYGNHLASYTGYTGPIMMLKSEVDAADRTKYSYRWGIQRASEDEFGLNSLLSNSDGTVTRVKTSMNLADRYSEGIVRFFRNPAQLQQTSRMHVYSNWTDVYTGSETLAEFLTQAQNHEGNPFALKTTALVGAGAEQILTNPANYERAKSDFTGYYRIRFNENRNCAVADREYATVRTNLAYASDMLVRDVITFPKARARFTVDKGVSNSDLATNASYIFCLTPGTNGTQYIFDGGVASQGYTLNTAIGAALSDVVTGTFDNCRMHMYPDGLGGAVITAKPWTDPNGRYGNGIELNVEYKDATAEGKKTLMMESLYSSGTTCYLEKVNSIDIKLTQIRSGEPSYGSISLPFDIVIPEGIKAYICTSINESDNLINITPATLDANGALPANTPVVLIKASATGSETITFPISGNQPSDVIDTRNLFENTNFAFYVPKVNAEDQGCTNTASLDYFSLEDHDVIRLFGKGGSVNKAGFYPFVIGKHCRIPANKAYIKDRGTGTNSSAVGLSPSLMMMISDENPEGDLTEVKAVITDAGYDNAPEFYDLQGRRVSQPHNGVFIVKSRLDGQTRKVYIK